MKSIFKSMSCLVLGAMIVTPMFAQQKKLYPELEGPGPAVIISTLIPQHYYKIFFLST